MEKSRWIRGAWAALAAFGCDSGEVSEQGVVQTQDGDIEVVTYELKSQIPVCNRDRVNLVYFVKSENQFFFCDGKKLQPIDLTCQPDKDAKTLVTTADAPLDQCPTGGVLIRIGLDANRNGMLDTSEIKSTARVCNGATGPEGPRGPEGQQGPRGPEGPPGPGADGGSCNIVNNGDGTGTITCSDGRTLTVVLAGSANRVPVARDDGYSVDEDAVLNVSAPGVLANDTDADGNALSARVILGPAHGLLSFSPDGSFSYAPAVDFSGTDSFTYVANDGSSDSAVATVRITVNAVNAPPNATPDTYSVPEDSVLNVSAPGVLGNDIDPNGDPLIAERVTLPTHGVLTFNSDGSFAYRPDLDFSGSDSFTYVAKDASSSSAPATVTINVVSINDPPIPNPDDYTTQEDVKLTVAAPGVLANDLDANGDTLTATLVLPPANGSVELKADGSFVYTPALDFAGIDTFRYRASDGSSDSAPETVTIVVDPAP
jgi:hypothetical protein